MTASRTALFFPRHTAFGITGAATLLMMLAMLAGVGRALALLAFPDASTPAAGHPRATVAPAMSPKQAADSAEAKSQRPH